MGLAVPSLGAPLPATQAVVWHMTTCLFLQFDKDGNLPKDTSGLPSHKLHVLYREPGAGSLTFDPKDVRFSDPTGLIQSNSFRLGGRVRDKNGLFATLFDFEEGDGRRRQLSLSATDMAPGLDYGHLWYLAPQSGSGIVPGHFGGLCGEYKGADVTEEFERRSMLK